MNYKRKKPKNARAGCLMCKPWKMNGASKANLGDVVSTSPGAHAGVCKGSDGWHDTHDWGVPFYHEYDRETHQHYRRTNPFFAPRGLFHWWERECQRCRKTEGAGREIVEAAFAIGNPWGVPPPQSSNGGCW